MWLSATSCITALPAAYQGAADTQRDLTHCSAELCVNATGMIYIIYVYAYVQIYDPPCSNSVHHCNPGYQLQVVICNPGLHI